MDDFDEEPPVVARLVVEIRSDGTRTVARGAIEDRTVGQTTTVQIDAPTPGALARRLMRALLSVGRLGDGTKPRRRMLRRLNPFRRSDPN